MVDLAWWVVAGLLALPFAYVLVRGVSFAYFRTKLEYVREAMKEMTKGDK